MIIFGGDKVVPVLKFNDHVISESRGSITKRLQEWYASTINEGTPIKIAEELLI
jgi:branched-subunit amino acid aminotransferase/4-amino-4-deoxychorismate lyase